MEPADGATVRLLLTPAQRHQILRATGRAVDELLIGGEELEARVVPTKAWIVAGHELG